MDQPKKGVLLVNLGTPDSTSTSDVRKYLREFLMDGRVIDISSFPRWMLVNLIIAPFRAPKSAREYRKLWEERGSPLKFYGEDLRDLVQKELGENFKVVLAMRYQSPGIEQGLKALREAEVNSIKVIPLFPQYASATTGSVIDKVMELSRSWQVIPSITFVSKFADHPLFIQSFVELGKKYMEQEAYDHFLFSYHGLPERQIMKGSVKGFCRLGACCDTITSKNEYCYRALCFQTTRLIAKQLEIPKERYTVCFQSRLGKDPWIQPYTEGALKELARKGIRKVLAFSPAFVADCLETTIEVGETYAEEFEAAGGEKWQLLESLNTHDTWVQCVTEMARS